MNSAAQKTSLADRILDCFPSGTYAISGLLLVWPFSDRLQLGARP
jgi:hypothetical protein